MARLETVGGRWGKVEDSPGKGIERTEGKSLGFEEDRVPATWWQPGLKTLTTSSKPWERAETPNNEAATNCNSPCQSHPKKSSAHERIVGGAWRQKKFNTFSG